jgi:hypothetical protein
MSDWSARLRINPQGPKITGGPEIGVGFFHGIEEASIGQPEEVTDLLGDRGREDRRNRTAFQISAYQRLPALIGPHIDDPLSVCRPVDATQGALLICVVELPWVFTVWPHEPDLTGTESPYVGSERDERPIGRNGIHQRVVSEFDWYAA